MHACCEHDRRRLLRWRDYYTRVIPLRFGFCDEIVGEALYGVELQCGTDPLGAFQQAVAYAVKPENEELVKEPGCR